jgi:hypothetical protein
MACVRSLLPPRPLTIEQPASGITCACQTSTILRCDRSIRREPDFALIESNLEFIAGQLARVPTRAYLCRTLLLATASVWALLLALWLLG